MSDPTIPHGKFQRELAIREITEYLRGADSRYVFALLERYHQCPPPPPPPPMRPPRRRRRSLDGTVVPA
jgi:hypothetical protein